MHELMPSVVVTYVDYKIGNTSQGGHLQQDTQYTVNVCMYIVTGHVTRSSERDWSSHYMAMGHGPSALSLLQFASCVGGGGFPCAVLVLAWARSWPWALEVQRTDHHPAAVGRENQSDTHIR